VIEIDTDLHYLSRVVLTVICVTAIYLTCVMLISGASIACSTAVLCVRHSDPSRRAPVWFRRLVMRHIARMLLMTCTFACGTHDSSIKEYPADIRTATEPIPVTKKPPPMKSIAKVSRALHHMNQHNWKRHGNSTARQATLFTTDAKSSLSRDDDVTRQNASKDNKQPTRNIVDPTISSSAAVLQHYPDSNGNSHSRQDEASMHSIFQDNHFDDGNDVVDKRPLPDDESRTSFDNLLEWHALGRVLDRMFFVIFTLAMLAVTLTLGLIYMYRAPTDVTATPIS